jgi:hypothetical protein
MTRTLAFAALAALTFSFSSQSARVNAEEPKKTDTVDIFSSVADADKEKTMPGVGVIYGAKEWERLAAAWGIKDPAKVDFNKEILLVGTWRGANFKFLSEVKNGDLTVELVGDKEAKSGFRYRVQSLSRAGITKFQGKELPAVDAPSAGEPKSVGVDPKAEKPRVALSGDIADVKLQLQAPANRVIASQKQWDALVKDWAIKDAPKVDFTKELLAVGTWSGSSFDVIPTVNNGDLIVTTKGTDDRRDGFRWKIVSVNRGGIKTVDGKAFPRE